MLENLHQLGVHGFWEVLAFGAGVDEGAAAGEAARTRPIQPTLEKCRDTFLRRKALRRRLDHIFRERCGGVLESGDLEGLVRRKEGEEAAFRERKVACHLA